MSISSGPNLPTNGLVLSLDAGNTKSYPGTGTSWGDLSGSGNHGALNLAVFDSGNLGSAFFNGAGDHYGYINSMNGINYSKVTISFWVKFSSVTGPVGNAGTIFGTAYWTDNDFAITQHATNYAVMVTFGVNNFAFIGAYLGTDPAFSETGKWYHFLFSYNSDEATWANALKIYIDGQSRAFYAEGNTDPLKTSVSIKMGWAGWSGFLNNICVYNRILTSEEVLHNYEAYKGRYL